MSVKVNLFGENLEFELFKPKYYSQFDEIEEPKYYSLISLKDEIGIKSISLSKKLINRIDEIKDKFKNQTMNDIHTHITKSQNEIKYFSKNLKAYDNWNVKPYLTEIIIEEENLDLIYNFEIEDFEGYVTWYTKFMHNSMMGVWCEIS
ncbi:hypothetical protein [Flammeovirga aprica]|uniref:Uncharacterized protein n=1 Tax=Flammeovirga aprica JL-4 TaxID=694437 RepID=A0A7X9XDJ9_9BACT|nr:hypothetical protein [Flammeovirga aprica]NME72927.1 hypothetical protein [Flammeovirga aprica JL-4]